MDANGKDKGGRPSLDTLQGVRKSMADVLRKMRTGAIKLAKGNALVNGYTQLAHLMQDARDTRYQKQIKILWEAHKRGVGAGAEVEAHEPEVQ